LNKKATAAGPGWLLKAILPAIKFFGVLDDQEKGAWSSVFAIASSDFKAEDSGKYVVPFAKFGTPSKQARDDVLARKLWDWSSTQLENS
jgi:hypothetical protein